jgi:hypothetical protein
MAQNMDTQRNKRAGNVRSPMECVKYRFSKLNDDIRSGGRQIFQ